MYFSATTIDDLMNKVLKALLKRPFDVSPSKGASSEIIGAMLKLTNPRARLSRSVTKGKPFSALGEWLWYLSPKNELDFIGYYIEEYKKVKEDGKYVYSEDEGKTVYSGYGKRLFNLRNEHDQIQNVIDLLKEKPTSRRAVIQIFDGADVGENHGEIPCTCTLQFLIRKKKLYMYTSMRSNDAYWGLPHDVFCFTMLQEVIARSLKVEVGTYSHAVGSLHLYKRMETKAKQYLSEGFQSTKKAMDPMPKGDPWSAINSLLDVEQKIRTGITVDLSQIDLDSYWLDLIKLLRIHSYYEKEHFDGIKAIKDSMSSKIYNPYIDKKILILTKTKTKKQKVNE